MDSFKVYVEKNKMFTSGVIKARNVHAEHEQRDLSQNFTRRGFLYGQ